MLFEAVGCKDIAPMPYAWIHRTDDVTVVKCNHTGETFFLSCTGTEWLGELHNCSKGKHFLNNQNGLHDVFSLDVIYKCIYMYVI